MQSDTTYFSSSDWSTPAPKIKLLLVPVNWSLQPWSRRSSYFLRRSQDYCFKSDLFALVKVYLHCRSSHGRWSVRKVLLVMSQNSQKSTCARVSFLTKLKPQTCNFIKKRLLHRCFPVNFSKFLKTTFFTEHLWATASGIRR